MSKLRSTVHEVAWQFNNLAYSSGLMFVWPGHFYNCFRSLFSSNRLPNRTELYWNSSQASFLNHTCTFYAIGLLDKSCMWKRKKLQYKIPATSSSYYINFGYFRSCKKGWKTCPTHNVWRQVWQAENQATHSLSLTTKSKLSTDLIFRSQQIWGDKKHVSVVTSCASVVLSI